jgi:hypothetical protein
MARLRHALAAGGIKEGVSRVRGDVRINGKPAQRGMVVKPGDTIDTGRDAELVVVVGRDAFLVRAGTRIELAGDAARLVVSALRVATGALLSVFAPNGRKRTIQTPTATIGIRGTGIYVAAGAMRSYICTCYGEAELVPVDDPQQAETVHTTHHDQPRYVYRKGMPRMIEKAPVINHTDAELVLLESLVGRKVPFDVSRY